MTCVLPKERVSSRREIAPVVAPKYLPEVFAANSDPNPWAVITGPCEATVFEIPVSGFAHFGSPSNAYVMEVCQVTQIFVENVVLAIDRLATSYLKHSNVRRLSNDEVNILDAALRSSAEYQYDIEP